MNKKLNKKHRVSTRKDIILKLIEEEAGYTIGDIAKRVFGEVTWFSRQQVGITLSALRKEGIPVYPRGKDKEVIIPNTLEDFRDVLRHIFDDGGLPTRTLRAVNLLINSALKHPALVEENTMRLQAIERPTQGAKRELKRLAIR